MQNAITAIDIDKESQKCFKRNAKLNFINNYNVYCCNGFNSIYLFKKKYNLIISNILLRSLKGLAKGFRDHLVRGGVLIISGVDKYQKNEIVNFYSKFNLKLLKSIYIENWVSLIFKKMQSTNKKLNDLNFCLRNKKIDYLLISTTDEFLNEYVPDFNMRLKWLTNFSGSNGYALVSGKENFFSQMGDTHSRQKKNFINLLKFLISKN